VRALACLFLALAACGSHPSSTIDAAPGAADANTSNADASACPSGCGPHQICQGSGNVGTCICQNECSFFGSGCDPAGSGQSVTCTKDSDNCLYISATQACPFATQTCAADNNVCACVTGSCTLGDQQCDSTGVPQRCVDGGGGCGVWQDQGVTCGAHQTCQANGGVASCVCDPGPSGCTSSSQLGAVLCASSTETAVCDADGDGCFVLDAPAACPSAQETCVDGGAGTPGVCTCPSTPLCTVGVTGCSAGTLSSCDLDATGGCPAPATTDCTAAPYSATCDDTPSPHCACAPPTANTIAVDGLHGDDTNGTGGAGARCAFKTITHALSVATSGDTVVVSPGDYSDLVDEANPIVIPDGVSLVTDAAPTSPDAYVIDDAIVHHAGSSTLGAFTIRGGWGVTVDGGTLTVGGTRVEAAESPAFAVYGSGSATIAGVTSVGSKQLVVVDSDGTTSVTDALSLADRAGTELAAGELDLLRVEIAFPALTGVHVALSSTHGATTAPAFSMRDSSVHDGGLNGIDVEGGPTGAPVTSIELANTAVLRNANFGIVVGAPAAAHNKFEAFGMDIEYNGSDGIVADTGSAIEAAFGGLDAHNVGWGVHIYSGTIWGAGQPGNTFDITDNTEGGIAVDGGAFGGIGYTRILRNHGFGARVNGDFSCPDCNVEENQSDGVYVNSVVTGLYLTDGTVEGNAGNGIFFVPTGAEITALVKGETITKNGATGIAVNPAPVASANVLTLTSNDVYSNYVNGMQAPAGATIVAAGNHFHSNSPDQIHVTGGPVGGSLTLDGGDCAPASANEIYCYSTAGVVVDSGLSLVIGHAAWAHSPPTQGPDFTGLVTVQNECTPAVTDCP
jgi:hypothetical protein